MYRSRLVTFVQKGLLASMLAVLLCGAFVSSTQIVSAQTPGGDNPPTQTPPAETPSQPQTGDGEAGGTGGSQNSNGSTAAKGVEAPDKISGFIYSLCIGLGGWFIWVGGNLLDYAVSTLVLGMGQLLNQGLGDAIDMLWMVIRDICNIVFIFGIIYIGFRTIMNVGDSSTKRMLVSIIAAALLINFSLYFAEVVIDFSNIAAHNIYKLIDLRQGAGVSDAFMQYSQIQTYANDNQGIMQQAAKDEGNLSSMLYIGYGFFMMLFLIIAACVFIAGAILLIIRFGVLVLYMIFSPILVVGLAIPGFESYSKGEIKKFFKHAFVAPAFIFMLYLSAAVMQTLQTDGSFAAALKVGAGLNGAFVMILYFCIMIMFMIASVIVAQKMGAHGADRMVKMGASTGQWMRARATHAAGTATLGTGGFFLRQTVGRAADKISKSEGLRDRAAMSGAKGWMARAAFGTSQAVADSSFDARNVGGVGKKLGLGSGGKGGYTSRHKAATEKYAEKQRKFAESLGEVSDDDPKVKEFKGKVDDAEFKIEHLRGLKNAAAAAGNKEEAEKYKIQIEAAEDELKQHKRSLQNEKNRRQIGSVSFASSGDVKKHEALRTKQKEYRAEYNAKDTTQERKEELYNELKALKKELAESQKKLRQGGLANMYKNSTKLQSLLRGKTKAYDKAAGEAILKAYDKKFKETDEDKRTASIVAELKKNNSEKKEKSS